MLKMKGIFYCWIGIIWLLPQWGQARPVSYGGGVTLMQKNDADSHSVHLHYSPTFRYSIGFKDEFWQREHWRFHGMQLNYLAKRWNRRASQANLYVKSGLGAIDSDRFNNALGGFVGMAADWENRRFFTSYANRLYDAGPVNQFFTQHARVGIAPYIGDYGDIHTWLMLQVDHQPEQSDPIVLTPLVRLFKHEYLTEIGVSEAGKLLMNLVIRF